MRLRGGIVHCGLVRITDFCLVMLFYSHVMFVKVMNVIIFYCVHTFAFLCGMCKVFSIGPYWCAPCRIRTAYADCGLFDVMYLMCSLDLNS